MAKKFYAIFRGRVESPTIVQSWGECRPLVQGVYAKYKSFSTRAEAEKYLEEMASKESRPIVFDSNDEDFELDYGNVMCASGKEAPDPPGYVAPKPEDIKYYRVHVYTDGSYNDKIGYAGYGIVFINDGLVTPFGGKVNDNKYKAQNVTGELSAIIFALKYAKQLNINALEIFYDYEGIGAWVEGSWKAESAVAKNFVAKFKELTVGMDVKLAKVLAHSGVEGNEMADKLARKGCGLE